VSHSHGENINRKEKIGRENENWVSFCTYAFRRPEKEKDKIARNIKTERFPPNAKRLDHFLSAGVPFRLGPEIRKSKHAAEGIRD
jgi:hypothetical protein